ncbi:uncharacterized protein LOC125939843 [Dermacentor silvarum]|uniref:uncharacterized protein LOC125939843 n=1 Tax=Dermacentor silvarum TaxID=543639 RepID=UPI00210174EE|nr:uncharacterized protein LOC125939843 [Dermacentor silvarum]
MKTKDILIGTGLRPVATISSVGQEDDELYMLSMTLPMARFAPSANVMSHSEQYPEVLKEYRRLMRNVLKVFLGTEDATLFEPVMGDDRDDSAEDMLNDEARNNGISGVVTDIIEVEEHLGKMVLDARKKADSVIKNLMDWQTQLGNNVELNKLNTMIRKLVKATLRIPNSTSNEKLMNLGVHNTVEEMVEAQQIMAQQERLTKMRAGMLILKGIGTDPN